MSLQWISHLKPKWYTLLVGIVIATVIAAILTTSVTVASTDGTIAIGLGTTPAVYTPELAYTDLGDGTYLYKNKWLCSYETLLFNTSDGDLGTGEYALDGSGTGYYIRTRPKTEAQFEHVDLTYKTAGLKKVSIVVGGYAYYDEFLTAVGATNLWDVQSTYYGLDPSQLPTSSVLRVQSTGTKYWDTARIADYPQPTKTEVIIAIPPAEPVPLPPEHHSIALDATSNSGIKTFVSSYSWSHTCTGANGLLVVGDSHRNSLDTTVTEITFNGDSMSSIRSDGSSQWVRSSLYYRVSPDTGGSYTVAVTLSSSIANAAGGAISYTGAAQTGQPDSNNGAVGSGNGNQVATVDVTTSADNSWVVSVEAAGGAAPDISNLVCNNTERWNIRGTQYAHGGSDTNAPKHPAGTQTMSWNISNGAFNTVCWAISAASFAPAVDANPVIGETPSIYSFGTIAPSSTSNTTTTYFTLSNNSTMQTDQTISVTSSTWSGGGGWGNNDAGTANVTSAALKAQRGGTWGSAVVIVKNASPNYIYENCPADEDYQFGLSLLAPTSFNDGVEKQITVRITAVAG